MMSLNLPLLVIHNFLLLNIFPTKLYTYAKCQEIRNTDGKLLKIAMYFHIQF